ncbi:patatin-like phospholipase family protein [Poseidonocella sp. HB161398]|uniref:DUF3734 domain-containing protein n=1 Tax=Poseidonocella sp. HB161398 TaxID=2320855 RepID=UPI00110958E5|nr:patatin-like phospholipase family protein [Poseidonocella sp. HB161398]
MPRPDRITALVLQGGGALGAYQAGAACALEEAGHAPGWVVGISIGAVNAALVCGNPPARRAARLAAFWEEVSARLPSPPGPGLPLPWRLAYETAAAGLVAGAGVPGFFTPRWPWTGAADSLYDTAPLRATLEELVDFGWLNAHGPRLSVGAVDIETGNFAYFDSAREKIGPQHIMASGAIPPGFPPVAVDGRLWWDGGLVSNTPLQYLLDSLGETPATVFQIDLFSARGTVPATLAEVESRRKDIQFSSRTRLTTDRYRELHRLAAAARRLRGRLPAELQDDPDLARLCGAASEAPVDLVHLIHRKAAFETAAKDYDFSRLSMRQHWQSGTDDVARSLADPRWTGRGGHRAGLRVFDLTAPAAHGTAGA